MSSDLNTPHLFYTRTLQTIETFLNFIKEYGTLSYVLLFSYCALKSGALPLFAGYAAQAGALDITLVAAAVFAGGYLGDETRFYAARKYGVKAITSRPRLAKLWETAEKLFVKYGSAYIFMYRYPKGLRTIGALPVGLTDMSWNRFTLLNASSTLLWMTLLVGVGYLFGETIKHAVSENWGLFSVGLLIVSLALIYFAWTRIKPTV